MNSCVIGGGSWGTALASVLAHNGPVRLWAREPEVVEGINRDHRNPRYQTDIDLPPNIEATGDLRAAVKGAELVCVVVPSHALRTVMSGVADALQPGWRDRVVRARWAPAQLVAGDLHVASDGGLAGRTTSSGIPGLALAGDWVGPHGMLADGCFASARAATASLLAGPTP